MDTQKGPPLLWLDRQQEGSERGEYNRELEWYSPNNRAGQSQAHCPLDWPTPCLSWSDTAGNEDGDRSREGEGDQAIGTAQPCASESPPEHVASPAGERRTCLVSAASRPSVPPCPHSPE